MVEATQSTEISYDVSFELKKHFTPPELTGKLSFLKLCRAVTCLQALRYWQEWNYECHWVQAGASWSWKERCHWLASPRYA